MGKALFLIIITAAVIILDHALKFMAKAGSTTFLKYVTNTGAAFSLLAGLGWTKIVLIIVSIAILCIVGFFYFKHHKGFLLMIALTLIFAGTLSNLIDRVFLGHVIDYIPFFGLNGLTFNLADVSNVSGVVMLMVHLMKDS